MTALDDARSELETASTCPQGSTTEQEHLDRAAIFTLVSIAESLAMMAATLPNVGVPGPAPRAAW